MEKPRDDSSITAYLEHSAFTVAGVAADPDVAGLEKDLARGPHHLEKQARALDDPEQRRRRSALSSLASRTSRPVVSRGEDERALPGLL